MDANYEGNAELIFEDLPAFEDPNVNYEGELVEVVVENGEVTENLNDSFSETENELVDADWEKYFPHGGHGSLVKVCKKMGNDAISKSGRKEARDEETGRLTKEEKAKMKGEKKKIKLEKAKEKAAKERKAQFQA